MKPNGLTIRQIHERDFLQGLSNALSESDLSKLDLRTLPGQHPAHSVLFDNYELNILRTPVYTYKNRFMRFLDVGDWKFVPDVFERYEICILENSQNVRERDILRYAGDEHFKTHNILMHRGTMATGRGYYPTSKYELVGDNDNVFYNQNAHLFASARKIYNILDGEYNSRQGRICNYFLSDIKSETDLQVVRMRMLNAVKRKQK
ncbi:MAG: hypothetical protein J6Q44_00990 [Alphaproteobacteria bacterium]|nr:hypothetical protein [Alphaproteobacteria bacterium]